MMRCTLTASSLLLAAACLPWPLAVADEPVEFNRDVRPILSDHCFACHGPDATNRQGDLRLDREEDAFARRERPVIVRGKSADSELYRRITAADPAERMPPEEAHKPLSPEQIETLRRWIDQGGKWQKHWSLIPPARPALPSAGGKPAFGHHERCFAPATNAIDVFIRAELQRRGMQPSPEAAPHTLLRRASFDLTGLPPTHEELDAFEADDSPDAYERAVDRLLASPRYGERMAIDWLEAARYADTSGYQSDGERYMWRWRDWVIDAFNRNMTFDQFTIEQLAGDLLPQATLDQKIATGFNRNHRGNAEGGIIPEEYAVEYVVDRVETTSTVWLGLTMGCVRCHDHKFDPFTMKDFYSLFAFFNNVPEKGRAVKFGNSPPYLAAPTPLQQEELAHLAARRDELEAKWQSLQPELARVREAWERDARPKKDWDWQPQRGLVVHWSAEEFSRGQAGQADGEMEMEDGRKGRAARLDGRQAISVGDAANFGYYDKFTLAAWIKLGEHGGGTIVSRMTDVAEGDGYQLAIVGSKLHFNLVKRWLDDSLRVESVPAISPAQWHHVAAVYDGSRVAAGVKLFVDGAAVETKVNLDELNQDIKTKEPLRIGGGGGPEGRFRGLIEDVRVFAAALEPDEIAALATPENLTEILALPAGQRGKAAQLKWQEAFVALLAPEEFRRVRRERDEARRAYASFVESLPTVMVMEEMSPPRKSFLLKRGQYDQPGEEVQPEVPRALPPMDASLPRNRLGLALWLVDPANPLTGRVTVNRLWQQFFGAGLVRTTEDFGSQGQWPTHPALLDWLAVEFAGEGSGFGVQGSEGTGQETGNRKQSAGNSPSRWDLKRVCRLIVSSAAYRQSSVAAPELVQKDPDNRWLARGPRQRLSAEMVRDQALAAGGLLVEELGGPSVRPYQPPGLWTELTGGNDYVQDHGRKLYRRSLYTFWKRTIAPPAMLTFDAATREFCSVRQLRTNTPLQALTLLNETGFVEASRKLAERALWEGGNEDGRRLAWLFRAVTSRRPSEEELAVLAGGLLRHREHYRAHPAAAEALLATGESRADERLDKCELAAFAAVASLVLNLDEAINKE
jgi:hypothetical protein